MSISPAIELLVVKSKDKRVLKAFTVDALMLRSFGPKPFYFNSKC